MLYIKGSYRQELVQSDNDAFAISAGLRMQF
jgi:hypothetical protein